MMAKTFKNGDRIIVTYPPTHNRKKEMFCSGVVRGYDEKRDEYAVKLDEGMVVYPKADMVERGLL
jgi:hypothetical protein